ncbi:hypothetical protein L0666_17045 [Octadecabacter sp. CECT 8868]|uniref:hypothetical protein n=1 Tax=Octadecabacter algicola TaxID=2909342 RepID=UPI001F162DA3|nr:hypothetical protein [Octadecabacter algicola]MCF2906702.1 hypothetical protein [Octadecabacter algicola]
MKKLALAATALIASTTSAFAACGGIGEPACTAVPEISALQGTAAIAAIAAVVLLVWERSRRAA